jgi:hypothetical protein
MRLRRFAPIGEGTVDFAAGAALVTLTGEISY